MLKRGEIVGWQGSGGALRAQARKPRRREGGFAAWGRAARSGTEVRFAAFARRRPRGPVLRTLPHPGHERRFAAHENSRNPCSGITPTLRRLRRRATPLRNEDHPRCVVGGGSLHFRGMVVL